MAYTRTILITGGTSGLGYEAALTLARQHPTYQIIIASRKDPNYAAKTINTTLSQSNTLFLPLDLASRDNIRTFITAYTSQKYPPIAALLLNAGLQFPNGLVLTKEGLESTFAINHLGHALLFHLLLENKCLVNDARIVITASGTHDPAQKSGLPDPEYTTAERLARPTSKEDREMQGRKRYANSKLCNVLWGYALSRRFDTLSKKDAGSKMTVVSFDPGLMPGTGLGREAGAVLFFVFKHVLPKFIWLLRRVAGPNVHMAKESGESLAWITMSSGETGVYFEGRKEIKSSVESYEREKQEALWAWTVKECAKSEEERKTFEIVEIK